MTRDEKIQAFKDEARARFIPFKNFKVWTVGKSQTIHVTCRHVSARSLEQVADHLIFLHRGQRYMTVRVDYGLSGVSSSSFCFKIGSRG